MNIAPLNLAAPTPVEPPRAAGADAEDTVAGAKELKDAYTQFVGETFYGSLLKSMRATVGEPAYFHGGVAEEMFQGRLDQQLATDLAKPGGRDLAESLFRRQFPDEAAVLDGQAHRGGRLEALDTLRQR